MISVEELEMIDQSKPPEISQQKLTLQLPVENSGEEILS